MGLTGKALGCIEDRVMTLTIGLTPIQQSGIQETYTSQQLYNYCMKVYYVIKRRKRKRSNNHREQSKCLAEYIHFMNSA